jgi:hypothetical protein
MAGTDRDNWGVDEGVGVTLLGAVERRSRRAHREYLVFADLVARVCSRLGLGPSLVVAIRDGYGRAVAGGDCAAYASDAGPAASGDPGRRGGSGSAVGRTVEPPHAWPRLHGDGERTAAPRPLAMSRGVEMP